MGLLDQIEKDEEELKKLEAEDQNEEEGEDDADNTDDDADGNEEGEDDDAKDGDTDDDDADNAEGDGTDDSDDDNTDEDSDDGEGDADNKDDKPPVDKDNDSSARERIERKKRLKAEEAAADQRERDRVNDNPPADTQDRKPESVEQRLERIELAQADKELHESATEELTRIENDFKADNPNYEDAANHMLQGMFQGVKQIYPNMSQKESVEFVQQQILQIAGKAVHRKMNPAEVLYQMAYDNYGFEPKKADKTPAKQKVDAVGNLKRKAKNKKRSANGLAGGGQNAGARVTIEEADNMSLADFGKLSPSEMDALIDQADS